MVLQTVVPVTDKINCSLTSTNNNNNILSSEKIGRKKFFLITGFAALGTAIVSAVPFGKTFAKSTKKEPMKVSPHPQAVKRTKKEVRNG
jgi:hypothetical protein